ncbi:hypothetical protein [Solimonas terrae]|uniref:SGNH/GDSL hydrolase family protein n=1 Tax=Solimonas terrae TaxID=1396819 RepID=A0A6M2BLH3_9GAMM|nr:hypothetical protein [Solimonas terrae]NGY03572.1 hypothetical protein [Solimonas terrae]
MLSLALGACTGGASDQNSDTSVVDAAQQHILFVGNSFTHGRYAPVRQYNSGGSAAPVGGSTLVVDENEAARGARAEDNEVGPYGGIPGLFAEFAAEAGLDYDVHIETISSATLQTHINAALDVIADPKWDSVVLQEQSTKPLPAGLADGGNSNPAGFCNSVQTLERDVHAVAPTAAIYLYETWPRADAARSLAGDPSQAGFDTDYAAALERLDNAYHDAYYRAAALAGGIRAVAPVGEAWQRAWTQGVAEANPYTGSSGLPSLWYGIKSVNDPAISSPDRYHPSVEGAYLAALVLFQQITAVDVRTLGGGEQAATSLGLAQNLAVQLQEIAWQSVTRENAALVNADPDPCTAMP